MKIHLISDMHWEMDNNDKIIHWISQLPKSDAVLVIAGDLTALPLLEYDLKSLREKYDQIVYVPGNHEYWGYSPDDVNAVLSQINIPGVHILMNTWTYIDRKVFFGGTGWFPYIPEAQPFEKYMNDFTQIKSLKPWVYEQNRKFQEEAYIQEPNIVVSHHLPTYKCVSDKFKTSPLNPFFLMEADDLWDEHFQPELWLFGHTHDKMCIEYDWLKEDLEKESGKPWNGDSLVEPCQMYCNPRGYPHLADKNYKPLEITL